MEITSEIPHHLLFSKSKISTEAKACIVIPVKDEEVHIMQTLEAFKNQTDAAGKFLDFGIFEILILANNCYDNTVSIIKEFQQNNSDINIVLEDIKLETHQAKIGYVRKLLMETAFKRLSGNGGGVIMTTDGDTLVSQNWIAQTFLEIEAGADAVGGRILFFPQELELMDNLTRSIFLKDQLYSLLSADLEAKIMALPYNTAPTHHQHFNGSFAVTTEFYGKSGGVPDVSFLEDNAFYERLQMVDAKIRMSPDVVVYTSARYVGRAEVGLSYKLNAWNMLGEDGSFLTVESCDSVLARFKLKKSLFNLWEKRKNPDFDFNQEFQGIENIFFDVEDLKIKFIESEYFGEWYLKFEESQGKIWREKYPGSPIDTANVELENALSDYGFRDLSQTSIR